MMRYKKIVVINPMDYYNYKLKIGIYSKMLKFKTQITILSGIEI